MIRKEFWKHSIALICDNVLISSLSELAFLIHQNLESVLIQLSCKKKKQHVTDDLKILFRMRMFNQKMLIINYHAICSEECDENLSSDEIIHINDWMLIWVLILLRSLYLLRTDWTWFLVFFSEHHQILDSECFNCDCLTLMNIISLYSYACQIFLLDYQFLSVMQTSMILLTVSWLWWVSQMTAQWSSL